MLHKVYYTRITQPIPSGKWEKALSTLSTEEQAKVLAFRRWEDRTTSLLGRLLIRHAFSEAKLDMGKDIYFNQYKRPCCSAGWDFNLSHCDDTAVLIIAPNAEVGIDVERTDTVKNSDDLTNSFTCAEWKQIETSPSPSLSMLTFWTRKEAVMKAVGSGLQIPPASLEVIEDTIRYEDKTWFIHPLKLSVQHLCHFATSDPKPEVQIQAYELRV